MKIDAATLGLANAWDAAWKAAQPTVPYVLDGEQFAEPNPTSSWVRFSIRHSTGEQLTQGRPARYRRKGNMMIQVFTPIDAGRAPLDLLVKSAIDAIETTPIAVGSETITTYAASPRDSPPSGQWAMATVVVPFDYYETK